eukprot:scaffold2263_cov187-Ochromonas_danica.AAC.15
MCGTKCVLRHNPSLDLCQRYLCSLFEIYRNLFSLLSQQGRGQLLLLQWWRGKREQHSNNTDCQPEVTCSGEKREGRDSPTANGLRAGRETRAKSYNLSSLS